MEGGAVGQRGTEGYKESGTEAIRRRGGFKTVPFLPTHHSYHWSAVTGLSTSICISIGFY